MYIKYRVTGVMSECKNSHITPVLWYNGQNGGCYGKTIHIGKNVWLGGDVKVLAGVSIGDNTIIGTGSIVTKDIPANVIAVGNPCRVIRAITEGDKKTCWDR